MPTTKKRRTPSNRKMNPMTTSPALLFATLISARKSGDEVLAAGAQADLEIQCGVKVRFVDQMQKGFGETADRPIAARTKRRVARG